MVRPTQQPSQARCLQHVPFDAMQLGPLLLLITSGQLESACFAVATATSLLLHH
jgi:hypothetical protein